MAVAIEDAGFEIRDQLGWVYGSGFPKSHDVHKAILKAKGYAGEDGEGNPIWCESCGEARAVHNPLGEAVLCSDCAASEWQGWGSALKPAWEPICLARKPLTGTIAENVLEYGTGALNIDGCRVGDEALPEMKAGQAKLGTFERHDMVTPERVGRWPANIVHDGSDEVLAAFPNTKSGAIKPHHVRTTSKTKNAFGERAAPPEETQASEGSAARFFYCAKASRKDRDEGLEDMTKSAPMHGKGNRDGGLTVSNSKLPRANTHPTVKPTHLMRWLARLVTPPGGVILDPFMGSGSTGKAALLEGFRFIGCEREDEYMPIAKARIAAALRPVAPKAANDNSSQTSLFGDAA